ncbi:hypothetical protein LIER_39396 [Lithospermum erythrorhizon]|uniref:Reverse transcriptase n=1 Tax=Lithospermum erythrorhizon TaxID=34254 RepID=A0AAV3QE11_LITER
MGGRFMPSRFNHYPSLVTLTIQVDDGPNLRRAHLRRVVTRTITGDEIESVMIGMKLGKAPGPDGFSTEFYKDTWATIKCSIVEAVHNFFATSRMSKYVNSTSISIIPKVQSPHHVKDFRSIACCNVIYKCISTIIANRLKSTLSEVVGIQQTTYVPGRSIYDGIMLM